MSFVSCNKNAGLIGSAVLRTLDRHIDIQDKSFCRRELKIENPSLSPKRPKTVSQL